MTARGTSDTARLALAIVQARTRADVCSATARALRAALGGTAAWVAVAEAEAAVVLAVDGDHASAPAVGELVRTTSVSARFGADAAVLSVGDKGFAVVLGARAGATAELDLATQLAAMADAALQNARTLEDSRAMTHRLEALLQLQRTLAGGLLEDTFAAFAKRLGDEVSFEHAWVGVLGPVGAAPGVGSAPGLEPASLEIAASWSTDAMGHAGRAGHAGSGGTDAPPLALLPIGEGPLAAILRSAHARSGGPTFVGGAAATGLAPWARSSAIVPLTVHDALVGVLVLASRKPHLSRATLLPDARWLLAAVAEPIALAVDNARLVAHLRAAMRDWQTTFDVMDSMVLVTDAGGLVRRANAALARRLGTSPAALVGRDAASLFPTQALPIPGTSPRASMVGPHGEALRASAVSLPGGGTVVVLHDVRPGVAAAPSQSYAALRRVTTNSHLPRGRVLVVDDEPSILRAVSRTLSRSHDVVTASDGDEALLLLRQEPGAFDAVMTDVQMPRLDGIALYRIVERELPHLADRVVFMTGGVFAADVESFLRSLKQRVLRKPFDPELLRRTVDERVALSRVA